MLGELLSSVRTFTSDLVRDLAASFGLDGAEAPPAPPSDVGLDTGGSDGADGTDGTDGSDGTDGGSDTAGGSGGDSGVDFSDTGWEGWESWDTAYPYVETANQTCYAEEKFKEPVCYGKGGKIQESELIIQGLKCSAAPGAPVPAGELLITFALCALVVGRLRR